MNSKFNKISGLQDSLYELADELNQLIVREHQILREEMDQVRVLVSDAVKNLDSNFRGLNLRTSEQADILNKVFKTGHVNLDQQERLLEISNQINSHASSTIRSLQFDDIVQQLAGHTCDRIARMQELFVELDRNLTLIKHREIQDVTAIQDYIKVMQEEVSGFRTRLEKENPVRQRSMDAGKIELF